MMQHIVAEENFCGLFAGAAKRCHLLQFCRQNLLRIATKPQSLWKFSPSKVSLYKAVSLSFPCLLHMQTIVSDRKLGEAWE